MEITESSIGLLETGKATNLPEIKPIKLGEYGRALEEVWEEFKNIRYDGFYAGEENLTAPRFLSSFAFHGHAGRENVTVVKENSEDMFPTRSVEFIPPNVDSIKKICSVGIISSDITFAEDENPVLGIEEETSGTADFWVPDREYPNASEYLKELYSLQKGNYHEYIVSQDAESNASSTLMFAFDTSHARLKSLMNQAMYDSQPKDSLWASQFGDYVRFPTQSGRHLAVPVGLPANYIEYIVVNEKSKYWDGKIDLLKEVSKVDNHVIPLVSLNTGKVL